jgi:hypothetical protein
MLPLTPGRFHCSGWAQQLETVKCSWSAECVFLLGKPIQLLPLSVVEDYFRRDRTKKKRQIQIALTFSLPEALKFRQGLGGVKEPSGLFADLILNRLPLETRFRGFLQHRFRVGIDNQKGSDQGS